jgi:hypothetical protein
MAKAKQQKWQHVVPQKDLNHEPRPEPRVTTNSWVGCATCGARIRRVDDNEGPESLKALFRF